MKTIDHIPSSKLKRAGKLVSTGAKVGVNYLKYYGNRLTQSEEEAREKLNEENAEEIYETFSSMKGSTLKVAQMLSMDKNILPAQYVEKFSLAQFSVPPLSAPLVNKTFREYFGKNPQEIFDYFDAESRHAASIGQVHYAEKNQQPLAVKIQYPGVAKSIKSDLTLVKPVAKKMFNLKGKEAEKYFTEVENKLIEETNYELEVAQGLEIKQKCAAIDNLIFPNYYQDLSSDRIITMDWMQGKHLSEFSAENKDDSVANKVGQTLWDFYMFQMHKIKKVHADPHPGNFLVSENNELIALDFGCMKSIPQDFYDPYFSLLSTEYLNDNDKFIQQLKVLEIIRPDDSPEEIAYFTAIFHELITLFIQPLVSKTFDFSKPEFAEKIAAMGEKYSKDSKLKSMNGSRGSRHFIYMHRTFFGLYNLMFMIGAKEVKIQNYLS